jgi:hypothetical protein
MSRLASQSLEKRLPFGLRLKIRLHLLLCVWCSRYFKQLRFLHHAALHMEQQAGGLPGRRLSVEARRRIVQHLEDVRGE